MKKSASLALFAIGFLAAAAPAAPAATPAATPVTLQENDATYTLSNGLVTAMVAKSSGDLVSLKYKGLELLASFLKPDGSPDLEKDPPGANPHGLNSFGDNPFTDHQYGFWSHDAMGPPDTEPKAVAKITIDPKSNNGERAEVSIKGVSNGRKMGTGPGSNMGGNFVSDIEIRYTMDRGKSGVYTYCVFEHLPSYAASTITEARFCFKLNDFFDWMLVDANAHRNKLYPKESRENKYFYTTSQFDNRAYGWASTTKDVGCFILNPSMEYMSGGATKVEFLCHRDTNGVAAPTVLNYWRSSHYRGATVSVAEGEHWAKVVGPFLIYANSGADPQVMWKDAIAQQAKEEAKWPYTWVAGIDYPLSDKRGTVIGQLVLNDPFMPSAKLSRALVGLAYPDQPTPGGGGTWQMDAKNYQFWVRADDNGKFTIPNVRPGTYQLHAVSDGVLGEYAKADVTVEAGKPLDLGKLNWTPVRYGKQLWDIGIPNRTSAEFYKGDDYFHNGMEYFYAQNFPQDVNYVIGKSDFRKDWYYMHIPHASDEAVAAASARGASGPLPGYRASPPAGTFVANAGTPPATAGAGAAPNVGGQVGGAAPAAGGGGTPPGARAGGGLRGGPPPAPGRASPWSISFDMPSAGKGTAVLRVALSRTAAQSIGVSLNGEPVGPLGGLIGDGSLGGTGVGIQGLWNEYALSIDASKLKQGTNVLTLTMPPGALTTGVDYDYVRLELNENAPFPTAAR